MYVALNQLPDSARLWIYQAARNLTAAEVNTAETQLRAFCESWAAHGHPLRGSYAVLEHRFVVLAVDETAGLPSGCSIDSSVRALRELETQLGVELLDKSRIAFRHSAGSLETVSRAELRAAVADGRLTPEILIWDNTVTTLGAWRTDWVRPAAKTWLARYFSLENNAR